MQTTVEFLAEVKRKHNIPSDYALAPKLEISRASVSRLSNGKDHPSDETSSKIADLLDLDPAYVIACVHAEREKDAAIKKVWTRIAERMAVAAAIFGAVGVSQGWFSGADLSPALLAMTGSGSGTVYIMSNGETAYWASFAALFALWLWAFPPQNRHHKKKTD